MHRYILVLFAAFLFFSGFQCQGDCDFFNNGSAILEVTLENPAENYSVGQTLWLSAAFSSTFVQENKTLTIGEGGGLVVSQLFRLQPDSSIITAGLSSFTPLTDQGTIFPNGPMDDPSATILHYSCGNGDCTFRQGFRIDSVGTYLLEVNGSSFEQTGGVLQFCGEPAFGSTLLTGGNNLNGVPLPFPLIYDEARNSFFHSSVIDTFQQKNLFLIRVE